MEQNLIKKITEEVREWRNKEYKSNDCPTIKEIFFHIKKQHYLRKPQIAALETYFYLRIVKETKSIPALYKEYFPKLDMILDLIYSDIKLEQEEYRNC